jgi:hypothetical protein
VVTDFNIEVTEIKITKKLHRSSSAVISKSTTLVSEKKSKIRDGKSRDNKNQCFNNRVNSEKNRNDVKSIDSKFFSYMVMS